MTRPEVWKGVEHHIRMELWQTTLAATRPSCLYGRSDGCWRQTGTLDMMASEPRRKQDRLFPAVSWRLSVHIHHGPNMGPRKI